MKKNQVILMGIFVFIIALAGCRQDPDISAVSNVMSGRVVAVAPFKSSIEPLIAESIQDSVVDVFFKTTNAKIVKGETGDIVITGVITTAGTTKSYVTGVYVTSISIQASKNGELLATYSLGQNPRIRNQRLPPATLAARAANYIAKELIRKHEVKARKGFWF